MKKILFLGAAPTQIPPITYALDEFDYLPDNPGHRLAHECHNISTTCWSYHVDIDALIRFRPRSPNRCLCSRTTTVKTRERTCFIDKSFFDIENAKKWIQEIGLPAFIKPTHLVAKV